MDFTLVYRPTERQRPFQEKLLVSAGGVLLPLATLSGACVGLELTLASDSLPFGTVVLGSKTTKQLQLSNTGDIGTKFAWDPKMFKPHFSIYPAEGFLAAGQDVKLEVTFHPNAVEPDIRVERLRCRLLDAPGPAATAAAAAAGAAMRELLLTLTGSCVASQALSEVLTFKCAVRASTRKSLTLTNPSSAAWQLRPVIQHDFWSGPEFLQVPAGVKAEYMLTYKPMTMTATGSFHEGSVFFPIPDGSGLLYKLQGEADTPAADGVIERQLVAKTSHTEVLKVNNWLQQPQRFRVLVERLTADKATKLEGSELVDVPALCSRDYKLSFYSYTQGLTHAQVTFKNETTGEHSYYEVKYTCSAPPSRGSLSFECPVRTQTSTHISVANPLDVPVTLKATVSSKQVSLLPDPPVLAANTTTSLEVCYRPLLVGSSEAKLLLESPELGQYEWGLRLTGAAGNPERSLGFSVPLGMRETQIFRFRHWAPEKADYKCAFQNSSSGGSSSSSGFDAPGVVPAPAASGSGGVELELEVGFEPATVGESLRDVLVVASPVGGEYQVPLVGRCVPPKPQGPVDVSKGTGTIPFRNVFTQEAEFLYSVDNPAFVLAKSSEKIPPKKAISISISYKPEAAAKVAAKGGAAAAAVEAAAAAAAAGPPSRMGKLTVSCPKQTGSQWVFYLQA